MYTTFFLTQASELHIRMVFEGGSTEQLQNHAKKMFQKYSANPI